MTARADNRLDDAPMVSVGCGRCGAGVLARKSSWNQTSVQWDAEASARCEERREAQMIMGHGGQDLFVGCSALVDSIVDAVRCGALPVVDT